MSKTYTDERGYLRFKDSDKLVHRWKAYKYIYKKSTFKYFRSFRHYVVHHKDGNKKNNRIDNLQILSKREHGTIHGKTSDNCFIATAAYGTPFEGEIQILRHWRDSYLRKHKLGNIFVDFYYCFSPPIAYLIRNNNNLRKLTRAFLNPIVKYLKKIYA